MRNVDVKLRRAMIGIVKKRRRKRYKRFNTLIFYVRSNGHYYNIEVEEKKGKEINIDDNIFVSGFFNKENLLVENIKKLEGVEK